MTEETAFYPISVFILNKNTDELINLIKKDLYHEKGIIFNDKDSFNIHKTTKIGVVISDFEEDWQVKRAEKLLFKLSLKGIKIFCISTGKIPEKLKSSSYFLEEVAIEKIPVFIKILQAFAYLPPKCLVCSDVECLLSLFDKDKGKIAIFSYQLHSTDKKEFVNFLHKNIKLNPQKLVIVIDMSLANSNFDGEEIVGICEEVLKPNNILFNICLKENLNDYQMVIYLLCVNDKQ